MSLLTFPPLLGPLVFLDSAWITCTAGPLTPDDVSAWPFSVNSLIEFGAFFFCSNQRAGRRLSVCPLLAVSRGVEIRQSCQFVVWLVRSLGHLPGGLSRFLHCTNEAHHSRLRHLGWFLCGHGLSSSPSESADKIVKKTPC